MSHRLPLALAAALLLLPAPETGAQETPEVHNGDELVMLDFDDVELPVVIDTIAKLTNRNFIYDDRVRGRITIISNERIPVDLAYAVFESALQMKGFTTVEGPGGAIRVIPVREAKEAAIETFGGDRPGPSRAQYITRLIPLHHIDAQEITNTLRPLVSKDAAMLAYGPTNSIILTDSAANINRILEILRLIDVETYREQQALFKIRNADAQAVADIIEEIYAGAEGTGRTVSQRRRRTRRNQQQQNQVEASQAGEVRVITDTRTNSLIVMASRGNLDEIRRLIARLDVPVTGGGRIHVYYLRNADAEELAQTLTSLITGQAAPGAGGQRGQGGPQAQALRAAVTELAEGISVTADPGTNSLVIQASPEGFQTLSSVIDKLDIQRPQVLVEAVIMEVDVTDDESLGFNFVLRVVQGGTDATISGGTGPSSPPPGGGAVDVLRRHGTKTIRPALESGAFGAPIVVPETSFDAILTAAAEESDTNVISAPHILTSDNEEAEIKIGSNIPIITSRVEAAEGVQDALATSVNVERQDVGVTLRVTPQISEGETLRLNIFQEVTGVIESVAGQAEQVGVTLTSRKIENTVVVADGQTVVIGGLISDDYNESVNKIPFLGDIPVLGWLFKSTSRDLRKENLIVFLTPHIVRRPEDMERISIGKREEFEGRSRKALELSEKEQKSKEERQRLAEKTGVAYEPGGSINPVRTRLQAIEEEYPVERLDQLQQREEARLREQREQAAETPPQYAVLAGVFEDEEDAAETLTELLDAGYDGSLVSTGSDGSVIYELRLGPYPQLEEAEQIARIVGPAYDLSPAVVVVRPEEP